MPGLPAGKHIAKAAQKQQAGLESMPRGKPENFGDIMVADHFACCKKEHGVGATSFTLGVMDRYTGSTDAFVMVGDLISRTARLYTPFGD